MKLLIVKSYKLESRYLNRCYKTLIRKIRRTGNKKKIIIRKLKTGDNKILWLSCQNTSLLSPASALKSFSFSWRIYGPLALLYLPFVHNSSRCFLLKKNCFTYVSWIFIFSLWLLFFIFIFIFWRSIWAFLTYFYNIAAKVVCRKRHAWRLFFAAEVRKKLFSF